MSKKVVKCGKFFDSVNECVKENMWVVVEGNKIVEVSENEVCCEGAEVIDLSDKFVMPGMIDTHMHVMMNGEPSGMMDLYSKMDADYAYEAMLNVQQDLLAGFTTIRDEGCVGFVDVSLKNAINSGKIWGPRMKVAGMGIGSTGGHGDSHLRPGSHINGGLSQVVNSPDEARQAARNTIKYGADHIKLMATGGVMSVGDEPGAPDLTFEEMKAALDIANTHGKSSSAHAHGALGIKWAVKAGIASIEHGMMMDEECMDLMVEHGTFLVPTIIAAYRIVEYGQYLPQEAVRKATACLENHGKNLEMCREKGVKIAFGTDTGTYFSAHGKQAYEFELMQKYGNFTVTESLVAATKSAAELLRMSKEVGSIEAGKYADIVAFNESPYDDISTMTRCAFVMKDGVVYKG